MLPILGQRWFSWQRLLCLVITAVALTAIFRRIDALAFVAALTQLQPGWFLLAIASYAVALLLSAWRWHLALCLTGVNVHPSVAARLSFIGHYLGLIFFGGIAGDIGKSTLYARWYQHPFPEVFAASPLDRLMGFVGLLLFSAAAFGFAAINGGLNRIEHFHVKWPPAWLWGLLAFGFAAIIVVIRRPPSGDHPGVRLLRTMTQGLAGLWRTPWLAAEGYACGFFVQLALSAVLALNLQAISHQPLPWATMLWTFPVISMLSSLPLTIAGLGVREGAAIVLLGLYDVPASQAVAVSFLSLAITLFWALIGAWLFWREERRLQTTACPPVKTISIVIPAWNEAGSLRETIRRARLVAEVSEVIVVDGGSTDGTADVAEELGCRVLRSSRGRGIQLRHGAEIATGDVVLLLHADTWLPPLAGRAIRNALRDPLVAGGGFWKVFQPPVPLFMLGSRWRCAVRFYFGRRLAGDQAMFARRVVLQELGGVPDWPLMEEFELCRRLRRAGRLAIVDATVLTSARRFVERGVLRTYARMWHVLARYWLGAPPQVLRQIYDRD